MVSVRKFLTTISGLFLCVSISHAQPVSENQILLVPHCLLMHVDKSYAVLTADKDYALISVNKMGLQQLTDTKHQVSCGGFINVTADWQANKNRDAAGFLKNYISTAKKSLTASNATYQIQYQTQVNEVLTQFNPQLIQDNLGILTSHFPNRSSISENGKNAADWIQAQLKSMVGNRSDVSIYTIETGKVLDWYDKLVDSKQPSIILKIGNSNEPGVVIGAHFDSVEPIPADLCKLYPQCHDDGADRPGADDDGSGSASVLAVAKTLLQSHLHFKKPIYFIWYAAEEDGLIGSQQVVANFQANHIPIAAVLQLDMTGFAYQNEPTMWLVTNYVDTDLTNYLAALIKEYVKQPVKLTTSNFGDSDHATWTRNGIPAAFPFEGEMIFGHFNLNMHTKNDSMNILSLAHMTDYAKLAIAFAIELGEPE